MLAPLFVFAVEALREAAKRGSFRGLGLTTRVPVPSQAQGEKSQVRDGSIHCAECEGMPLVTGRGQLTGSAKGQCSHLAH
ncbi:hypothetical protein GCM10010387_11140 [Streptomyces inusitatus]|uniref:Uncharacterized protein n=1 Tax=Streptomyces inusitatus TaxID=68221 RepID=A0A918PQW1_9ACTN|nr:hypothetical protein GCM10010387_11140 [Streptomyces inusitatus]